MYSFKYPNLRAEFGRQALTVSGVAESIGTTRAQLSRALSGETKLSLELAFALRDKYFPDKRLEYLFQKCD